MAHEVFYEIDEHFTSLTVKSKENHSPVVTAYWPASLEQNGPICELSTFFPIPFQSQYCLKVFATLTKTGGSSTSSTPV